MDPHELKADLEDFVASKGWAWLVRYARQDLDDGYMGKIQAVVETGGDIQEIRQLMAIRKYVLDVLLRAPYLKMDELVRGEEGRLSEVPAGHRRGKHV